MSSVFTEKSRGSLQRKRAAARCVVRFYWNVFSAPPRARMNEAAAILEAIHAQESNEAARKKAQAALRNLQDLKLKEAVKKMEAGMEILFIWVLLRSLAKDPVIERMKPGTTSYINPNYEFSVGADFLAQNGVASRSK